MRIFISWSGDLGQRVARQLREWLPNVIQAADPYLSATDIKKGSEWFADISKGLRESDFGVVCLTRESLDSNWIHFEAGAIANKFDMDRTACFLVDVEASDVKPPLGQFQHTLANREDVLGLVETLNAIVAEKPLSAEQLRKSFTKWWPDLESSLEEIRNSVGRSPKPGRSDTEKLDEVLELSRSTLRVIYASLQEVPPRNVSKGRWQKVPHQALTLVNLHLTRMIDSGKYDQVTTEEVLREIDNGTIVRFLQETGGPDIDLSVHLSGTYGDFEAFWIKNLQSFYDAYGDAEKWGVRERGLCLLVAWTNEILQLGSHWKPWEDFSER